MKDAAKKTGRFDPRAEAVSALEVVERRGADSDEAIGAAVDRHARADRRDRALMNQVVMGALRMRGTIDAAIETASDRPVAKIDGFVLQTLRVAAYQIMFLDRVPAHAAVNSAVESVKHHRSTARAAGFVNAVLRALARSADRKRGTGYGVRGTRMADAGPTPAVLSHPAWLIGLFNRQLGEDGAAALCHANNAEPPFTVRAIALKIERDALARFLFESEGIESSPGRLAPQSLILKKGVNPSTSPSFAQGLWTVQDEAAQLVSLILDPKPGERILDACAAPGGKTAHIAELMLDRGEVVAVDRDRSRLNLVDETVRRLGLSCVKAVAGDASKDLPFKLESFDRILVDAPCTGLGTLRRSPEIKWRVTIKDLRELAARQLAIVKNASKYLKPGGVLVYSVCTVTDEEGPQVIEAFTSTVPGFHVAPSRLPPMLNAMVPPGDGLQPSAFSLQPSVVRLWPHLHGTDGFFIAKLLRTG